MSSVTLLGALSGVRIEGKRAVLKSRNLEGTLLKNSIEIIANINEQKFPRIDQM